MWKVAKLLPYEEFHILRGVERARYIELHGKSFLERPPGSWEGEQQKWRWEEGRHREMRGMNQRQEEVLSARSSRILPLPKRLNAKKR